MRPLVLFIGVLLLCQCSDRSSNSNQVDLSTLVRRFETARPKASQLLEKVTALEPNDVLSPDPDAPAKVVAWYAENRAALRSDIDKTPPYRWSTTNPNGDCRQTDARPAAEVSLSYEECQISEADASIQLIGASVVHLGGTKLAPVLEVSLRHAGDRLTQPGSPVDSSAPG
jgi:hypothetical protein